MRHYYALISASYRQFRHTPAATDLYICGILALYMLMGSAVIVTMPSLFGPDIPSDLCAGPQSVFTSFAADGPCR